MGGVAMGVSDGGTDEGAGRSRYSCRHHHSFARPGEASSPNPPSVALWGDKHVAIFQLAVFALRRSLPARSDRPFKAGRFGSVIHPTWQMTSSDAIHTAASVERRAMTPRRARQLKPARFWIWIRLERRSTRRRIKRITRAVVGTATIPLSTGPESHIRLIVICRAVGISRPYRRTVSTN